MAPFEGAVRARLFHSNFWNPFSMKKSAFTRVLARRLNIRLGRLNSLVQRAAEVGQLPMAVGTHYPQLEPVELARMVLVGICDQGLSSVDAVISKYGGLPGPGSTLEQSLGHALTRPESFAPSCTGLEVHTGESPHAILTTVSADGARTLVFGEMPAVESVDRTVLISGAALFAISNEVNGLSAADVDRLLQGADTMRGGL